MNCRRENALRHRAPSRPSPRLALLAALTALHCTTSEPSAAGPSGTDQCGPEGAGWCADSAQGPWSPAPAPALYSGDRTQSPLTADVIERLREIARRGAGLSPAVFMKVGDSLSIGFNGWAGGSFLSCVDPPSRGAPSGLDLARDGLLSLAPTLGFFGGTTIAGATPFRRASAATRVGVSAGWALSGAPSPLEVELRAARPQYAVVLYGTNDVGLGRASAPSAPADQAARYERELRAIVDRLLSRGVIPVLTTPPPREDRPEYARAMPALNGVVRAVAQGRQIPMIDLYRELAALPPPHGLGRDGVHLSCAPGSRCCAFDSMSLKRHGFNVRNLVTLQALDRLRRALSSSEPPPDKDVPRLAGDGSPERPFRIDALPFADLRAPGPAAGRRSIPTCGRPSSPAAARVTYRLALARPTALRILALDAGARAVRVSLVNDLAGMPCLAADERMIAGALEPGLYELAVEAARPGVEFTLSATECLAGDPACAAPLRPPGPAPSRRESVAQKAGGPARRLGEADRRLATP